MTPADDTNDSEEVTGLKLVLECETLGDVSAWVVDDLHVWPLVRMNLAMAVDLAHAPPRPQGRLQRAASVLRGLQSAYADRGKWGRIAPADVAFLSTAETRQEVGGLWYDPFSDPLIDLLEADGLTAGVLETARASGSYRVPRARPSHFVQPALFAADLRRFLEQRAGRSQPKLTLPGYEEVIRHLGARGFASIAPTREALGHVARNVLAMARYFEGVLRRMRPRLAFCLNYAGPVGMAYVRAARRAGAISVDIQHGGMHHHPGYETWRAVPKTGYDLRPDFVWCWSPQDATAVEPGPGGRGPRPVVGGNPWACYWEGRTETDPAALRVAGRARESPGATRALLSLQWDVGLTPELKGIVAASPPDWLWWIRLHPLDRDQRIAVTRWAELHGGGRCVVDDATDVPLPVLLRHTDVHLTRSSSVVSDAARAGLSSVIVDRRAKRIFPQEVAAGRAVVATERDQVIAELQRLATAGRSGVADNSAVLMRSALASLLEARRPVPG